MKKILALVLALLCVMMCFVACNKEDPKPEETTPDTTTAPVEKPVLKMATNAYFQPYEFYKDGKIVGIDFCFLSAVIRVSR